MDRDKIDEWDRERQEWVVAIGEYMLLCGDIEACTYDLLESLLSDDLPKMVGNLNFGPRCDLIKELIPQKLSGFKGKERLLELMGMMEKVSQKRNVIAHNPLDLKIVDARIGVDTKQVIRRYFGTAKSREESEVTLHGLQSALGQQQLAYSELNQLAYRVRKYLDGAVS